MHLVGRKAPEERSVGVLCVFRFGGFLSRKSSISGNIRHLLLFSFPGIGVYFFLSFAGPLFITF
jgi:hypothetical protein